MFLLRQLFVKRRPWTSLRLLPSPNLSTSTTAYSSPSQAGTEANVVADNQVSRQAGVGPVSRGSTSFFTRAMSRFPTCGRCLAFAYGSGVFEQTNNASKSNMTDFVIAVEDPVEWHKQNMETNPKDYSGICRRLGPDVIAKLQDGFGARMFFNTLVPFEGGLIKYGVISKAALVADLLDWENLYVSGRLQKPVKVIELVDSVADEVLEMALRVNLKSALHTALLLLPETFNEEQLFSTICSISYTGDFRMILGEDKNKVSNIVKPNLARFRQLYSNRLRAMSDHVVVMPSRGVGEQDLSPASRHFHFTQLPKTLQWNLVTSWNRDGRYRDVEDVLRAAAFDQDSHDVVQRAIGQIVAAKSLTQAAKGIVSAGLLKAVLYSGAKLRKMVKSLRK